MRDFTQSLCELVNEERVHREVAFDYAPNRDALRSRLKGIDTAGEGLISRMRK